MKPTIEDGTWNFPHTRNTTLRHIMLQGIERLPVYKPCFYMAFSAKGIARSISPIKLTDLQMQSYRTATIDQQYQRML